MTVEQQITAAITKGKALAQTWASDFILRSTYGEDLGLKELKLVALTEWIDVLEDYKIENFGDSGSITPDVECLTQDQVILIVSKINLICD